MLNRRAAEDGLCAARSQGDCDAVYVPWIGRIAVKQGCQGLEKAKTCKYDDSVLEECPWAVGQAIARTCWQTEEWGAYVGYRRASGGPG